MQQLTWGRNASAREAYGSSLYCGKCRNGFTTIQSQVDF